MQRFFILFSFLIVSAAAAQAQTVGDQKPLMERKQVETVKCLEDDGRFKAIVTTPARTNAKKEQLSGASVVSQGRVLRLGPSTTFLKAGLSAEEVLRILGKPATLAERQEGQMLLSVYTFERSGGRVLVAEFENNVLVRSRTELSDGLALSK